MSVLATVKIGILLSIVSSTGFAQLKYSIDIEPAKNRRVKISYQISTLTETMKINKEVRQRHRAEQKLSRQTRRHIYHIQTKEVKKRMRKARKKAEGFYREKSLICVTLNKLF